MKCLSRTEPTHALKAFNYVQYMVACLMCFFILQLIFKKFSSGKSESDSCTLYSKHPHIRTQNFRDHAEQVFIFQGNF